jgi:hypothetical protein
MGEVFNREVELRSVLQKYVQGDKSQYFKIVKKCLSMESPPT